MSKPYKVFRIDASQTVKWTWDAAMGPADEIPLTVHGSWKCGGCGHSGQGTLAQAQQHAGQRHEPKAGPRT